MSFTKKEIQQFNPLVKTKTADHTAALADIGYQIHFNDTDPMVFTIPANATVPFPVGSWFMAWWIGEGELTIELASGVSTINSVALGKKGSGIYFQKLSTNLWLASGGLPELDAPVVTAGTLTDTAFPATWVQITGNEGYEAQIATDSGFTSIVDTETLATDDTAHTFTGLTPETLYYVRVKALGDGSTSADSPWSNVVSDTTEEEVTYDTDAQTYFTAIDAALGTPLSSTYKDAWDAFVVAAKADSVYTIFKGLYPLFGGVAAGTRINARTPGTFDITWGGTVTHAATGTKGNASTGYGDTGIVPSSDLSQDAVSAVAYIRDDPSISATIAKSIFGATTGTTSLRLTFYNPASSLHLYSQMNEDADDPLTTFSGTKAGIWWAARTASGARATYQGATTQQSSTNASSTPPTSSIMLHCENLTGTGASVFDNHEVGFFGIVDAGITSGQRTTLNGHLQTLFTAISR